MRNRRRCILPTDIPPMISVVLASASPRRKALLQTILPDFQVIPANVDESFNASTPALDVPEFLAGRKAAAVAKQIADGGLVVGADTIVVLDNEILNKPADSADAIRMLLKLSGRTHQVVTGVALVKKTTKSTQSRLFSAITTVHFGEITQKMAETYVQTGSPLDKAGSYGIQDAFMGRVVRKINGDFNNVVGFPVFDFYHQCLSFCPECFDPR